MFRLTREVRLAIGPDSTADGGPSANGFAGSPAIHGMDPFVTVRVTVHGEPDPASGYLINIKQIDQAVRRDGLPLLRKRPADIAALARQLFDRLRLLWPSLEECAIGLSPYTSYSVQAREHPMVRFNHKFEFSAAHRLHNPELSDQANADLFGKCNNPNGHGHNYELQVSLRGEGSASAGRLIPVRKLEEIVSAQVIQRFDHKFLNLDTPEFRRLNPTVENIARTIHGLLKKPLADAGADLASVTVWETPKTWCEFEE
jgi:6-pyruvoyltetrahydropterin/6-carboxytetrahydropterin synthase